MPDTTILSNMYVCKITLCYKDTFKTQKEIIAHDYPIGEMVTDGKRFLKIATKDGFVELLDVQLTKRKRMDVKNFLNGYSTENMTIISPEI